MQTARPTASFQPSLISSFQCGAYSSQAVGTPYTISGPTSSCRMESSVAPQPPVTQSFRPPVVRQQDSTSASRSAETYVRQPVGTTTRAQPVGITVKVDDGAGKPVIAQQQNSSAPRRAEPSVTQTFSTVRAKVVEVQDGSKPAVVRQQDSSSASRSAEPYVRQPVGTTTRAQPVGITVKVDDGGMPVIASQEESSASRDAEPSVLPSDLCTLGTLGRVGTLGRASEKRTVKYSFASLVKHVPEVDDGGMPVIASQEESSASRDAEPSVLPSDLCTLGTLGRVGTLGRASEKRTVKYSFASLVKHVAEVDDGGMPVIASQEESSASRDAEPSVLPSDLCTLGTLGRVGTLGRCDNLLAPQPGHSLSVDDGGMPVIASQEESSASRDAEPSVLPSDLCTLGTLGRVGTLGRASEKRTVKYSFASLVKHVAEVDDDGGKPIASQEESSASRDAEPSVLPSDLCTLGTLGRVGTLGRLGSFGVENLY
eukprot:Skav226910  [mRNA]  locus=scaffold3683:76781:81566:- [translate_table: standard]